MKEVCLNHVLYCPVQFLRSWVIFGFITDSVEAYTQIQLQETKRKINKLSSSYKKLKHKLKADTQ